MERRRRPIKGKEEDLSLLGMREGKKLEMDELQDRTAEGKAELESANAKMEALAAEILENQEEEQEVKWRKIGKGTMRLADGRVIDPRKNPVFKAKPSEVSSGLRRFVVQLSGDVEDETVPIEVVKQKYSLTVRSPGWYDIKDASGKVINEKALRPEQAKEMLKSLEGV